VRYEIFARKDIEIPEIDYMGFSADSKVAGSGGVAVSKQYLIHFVIEGRGYYNGVAVESGQGFIITKNTLAEYHPDPMQPWEFLWIVSQDERMQSVFEMLDADPKTGVFDYKIIDAVSVVADKIKLSEQRILSSAKLCEYFVYILNCEILQRNTKKNVIKDYFRVAVDYIESHLISGVSVVDLCVIIGITQPYLYRIFKEKSGLSPKQYIDNYRIQKAKFLLKNTELTITQIAASVGMPDALAFSKFFSKNVGASPSVYRKTG
jgi:AraC-like DNA-binding protein